MIQRIFIVAVLVVSTATSSLALGWANRATVGAVQAPRVVAQSAVPVSIYSVPGWTAAPLAETVLASYTLPGGTLGANGALRAAHLSTVSNSANNKTLKFKLGTYVFWQQTPTTSATFATVGGFANRGVANSQVNKTISFSSGYGGGSAAVSTGNIDTDASQVITVTGQTTLETGAAVTAVTGAGGVCTATLTAHGLNTGEYVQMAGGAACPTSGNPNADPVLVTVTNSSTFTYPCSCVGTEASTKPTQKRYSVIQLENYTMEVLPSM